MAFGLGAGHDRLCGLCACGWVCWGFWTWWSRRFGGRRGRLGIDRPGGKGLGRWVLEGR